MTRLLRLLALITLAAFFATPLVPAQAATEPAAAAQTALGWLLPRQNDDGSFPGFDSGASIDAIFAIVAAGADPNGVLKNGNSPVSFMGTQAAAYATKSAAAAGKLTLAVVAAGKDPLNFGGHNMLKTIYASYDPASGKFGSQTTDHVYALLALAATGQNVPTSARDALVMAQLPDGGWSYDGTPESGSDTNTTALAVQALVALDAKGAPFNKAVAFLKSQQNDDGGFPYAKASAFGADSDANSTALTIQALVAAGEDPQALARSGGTPQSALLALQNDSGAFRYQAALPDDNDLATAQAIPALFGKAFPLKRVSLPQLAQPTTAPARLPTTGANEPLWLLLVVAGGLVIAGRMLRVRV